MKKLIVLIVLLPSLYFNSLVAQTINNSKKTELFNKKNLNGWYTYIKGRGKDNDPCEVFKVQDGLLYVSGEEFGCVTTHKEFEDYRLVVEFKWGNKTYAPREGKAMDSGVLLHSVGNDGNFGGAWMNSIECQIIEGGTGDFVVVGDGSPDFAISCPVEDKKQGGSYVFDPQGQLATIHKGRINWYGRDPEWKDEKGFKGSRDIEKKTGKWNRLECIAQKDEIKIFLNGKLVNHAFDVKPHKGKIQVQSEGAEIIFRKIEITEK